MTKESKILIGLRTIVYFLAFWFFFQNMTLPSGIVGGMLGIIGGMLLAVYFSHKLIRPSILVLASFILFLFSLKVGNLINNSEILVQILGSNFIFVFNSFFSMGLFTFSIVFALRTLTLKWPTFSLLELAVVIGTAVNLVIGHRGRNISEPRIISDWAWVRGEDPSIIILAIGVLALCISAILLIEKQKLSKTIFAISNLALIGLILFFIFGKQPFEPPPSRGPLGLTGDPASNKVETDLPGQENNSNGGQNSGQDPNGGGSSGSQSDQQNMEMPLSSDYPQGEPAPVAIVLFHDDYKPVMGYYYFRQTAFSQYNGTRLIRSFTDKADNDLIEDYPVKHVDVFNSHTIELSSTTIETTVALISEHRQPFGLANPLSFDPKENPNTQNFRRAYTVVSKALTMPYENMLNLNSGNPKWSDALKKQYLEFPSDPRYKELADQIISTLQPQYRDLPIARAFAIRIWLEKNVTYARHNLHNDGNDPTATFLFGERRGFCVHIAHAMVFLMRAAGVPSRVAAGYAVEEGRLGNGSSLMIQDQDAHAWAELYLDGLGWVIMDVAPEKVEDPPENKTNQNLQQALGELARQDGSAGKQPDEEKSKLNLRLILLVTALILLGLLILFVYGMKIWFHIAPAFASEKDYHRVAFRALLINLAESGLYRNYGETREDFARRMAREFPGVLIATNDHLSVALGKKHAGNKEHWKDVRRAIKKELWIRTPWYKIVWGFINPVSWYWTR